MFLSKNKALTGNRLKKQVTINLNEEVIDYFKQMSEQSGFMLVTTFRLLMAKAYWRNMKGSLERCWRFMKT